jgi:capsular exopolysaccharide synthesis family protein
MGNGIPDMAKVLDALEKARLERERKFQQHRSEPATLASADDTASSSIAGGELRAVGTEPVADTGRFTAPPAVLTTAGISPEIVAAHDPQSPITEQARHIRTNLETVLADYQSRPIVISSPVSGDGKTLVAANLAWVLADNPEREVILIDADMRKPDQHRLFGLRQSPGLSEALSGACGLDDAIQSTAHSNLKVITAGRTPEHPSELLGTEHLNDLLSNLQRRFGWIVFDTPPLLPVTDASMLARESVGMILVMRMGRTHFEQLERAQELMAEMRLPVLGCIVNALTTQSPSENYYNKYYAKKTGKGAKGGFRK